MGKYGKLLKNSAIFALANVGSYLISFLLVRFNTELLTTDQYGIVDFFTVTASLVIPIFTLAVVEAVLRFSIDHASQEEVLVNGIAISIFGTCAFFAVGSVIFSRTQYSQYFIYLLLLVFTTSTNNVCAQYARGSGRVTVFAISGIVKSVALAGSNIVLVMILKWNIHGYLLSLIFAEIASISYIFYSVKLWNCFRVHVNKKLFREMVIYSMPLIPNSLSWWGMNASDKYVIFAVLGPSAAGIYAVSHKIPTLINLCNRVFFQAWQLSAVEESGSESKVDFYTEVFNFLSMALILVAAFLMLFLRPMMDILTSDTFGEAWKYSPFLIIGLVFSAFAGFLGTNYVAMKKTNGAMKTTLFGVVINLVLNVILVYPLGMTGTAAATMVGFMATWLYRAYDTRSFVKITYNVFSLTVSFGMLILQACMLISESSFAVFTSILACFVIILVYRKDLLRLTRIVISVFHTKFKH